jgi:hypothetical protein
MIVYHVCGISKFDRYRISGCILPPVRAWADVTAAERFSKQTGRPIIIRLKFPDDAEVLDGHHGQARVIYNRYLLDHVIPKGKT